MSAPSVFNLFNSNFFINLALGTHTTLSLSPGCGFWVFIVKKNDPPRMLMTFSAFYSMSVHQYGVHTHT